MVGGTEGGGGLGVESGGWEERGWWGRGNCSF
jgi:hypothetical protein